jgi:hypothetical protein
MNTHLDEHEPEAVHALDCAIWTTSFDPCNCQTTSPTIQRLSTAQRLDLIQPAGDPIEAA